MQRRTIELSTLLLASVLCLLAALPATGGEYTGPLPDWNGDRHNWVMDYETGDYLRPLLDGSGFEFPKSAHCDWNDDGVFDLIVGYNLRTPDSLRTVIYINQGERGAPLFSGRDDPSTCFYLSTVYPGESSFKRFSGQALPMNMHPHSWTSHIPNVYDFTGDGLFDLLMGEMNYDNRGDNRRQGAWLLVNTGSKGNPEFGICAYLHREDTSDHLPPGPYLDAMHLFRNLPSESTGSHPTVNLVDWDSDGIVDISYCVNWTEIIYGEIGGDGKWKPRSAAWSSENYSREGGEWGGFGRVADLATVDFDGDGVNELLVGDNQTTSWGSTEGYLNLFIDDPQNPGQYTRDIEEMYTQNAPDNPDGMSPGGWWHPKNSVVDWDEDGDPDVLVGWGGGNTQPASQMGERLVLIRMPGGTPGVAPLYPNGGTPVLLSSLSALRAGDRAVVQWEMNGLYGNESLYIHRSQPGGQRELLTVDGVVVVDGINRFIDQAPFAGATEYWLEQRTDGGNTQWFGPASLSAQVSPTAPRVTLLASPNPTRGETTLSWSIAQAGSVELSVYDVRGRRVAVLERERSDAGDHLSVWDGRDDEGHPVSPGVYLVRLSSGNFVETRKVSVLR